jgi:uncharacterized protein YjeT (DUF2065 family)
VTLIALGLGLVLVIEGLALALAPSRLDQALAILASMNSDMRRRLGLAMIAGGAVLLMVWRLFGEA